jgi:sec-independent protein translocase protein TatB
MILLVAALVILGPERLPGAMQWTMKAVRQAREYVDGAAEQLRSEVGSEMDPLREPLTRLNELRRMSPRAAVTKYLLDGDDSILTGEFGGAPGESAAPVPESAEPAPQATGPVAPAATGEAVDPANCGLVRPELWGTTAAAPPVDLEAT